MSDKSKHDDAEQSKRFTVPQPLLARADEVIE